MLYLQFTINDPAKYDDFLHLYNHMNNIRRGNYTEESEEEEEEIDWAGLTQEEEELLIERLLNEPKEEEKQRIRALKRYEDILPLYAQNYIEERYEAASIFYYLEYGFEVDFDALIDIEEETKKIEFSTHNYPYGGIDRFIQVLQAYELQVVECYNGFDVCYIEWSNEQPNFIHASEERTKVHKMSKLLDFLNFSSDRLQSRALEEGDAATLYELYADEGAMQYRGSGAMTSLGDAQEMINQQSKKAEVLVQRRWGITLKDTQELIGTLLLSWKADNLNSCKVGLSLGRAYWKKGYARELLMVVEQKLQVHKKWVNQLTAWVRLENAASIRLFKYLHYRIQAQEIYPQSLLFTKEII